MKQLTILRLRIVPAVLLLCLSGVAQQRPDTAVKQELALEVNRGNGRPWDIPAFNGGNSEAADFRRIRSWNPASGESPVAAIIFRIGREDDIVIAHLSVRLENDKVVVGAYRLREDETIKTEELTNFGLEPLALKVVKAKPSFKDPSPLIHPQLENKTKAIEVVSFYQEAPPSEIFRLTLRNASDKNIIALDLFTPSADGNGGEGQRSQGGNKDHPVMLPGGTSVIFVGISHGGRMTSGGFVPEVAVPQTLIIRTVVFDDGTYEGLAEPAAEMEAQNRGLEIQRRRVLRLLQEPKKTVAGDLLITLDDLKEEAYALGRTADESVTLELTTHFPSLGEKSKGRLRQSVEAGLREGKLELLRYINDFEEMQKAAGKRLTFAEWLKQTKAKYETLTSKF